MIQADAAGSQTRLELSALHPGLPVKRVPIHKPTKPQNALTAGEMYDLKRSVKRQQHADIS
jgi:hypothetical protein